MAWNNGPLLVHHGTDAGSAQAIAPLISGHGHRINLALTRLISDFGRGFYTATNGYQARQWANQRALRLGAGAAARVISFSIDRTSLDALAHLAFVSDDADIYHLVVFCSHGHPNHGRTGGPYDVVHDRDSRSKLRCTFARRCAP